MQITNTDNVDLRRHFRQGYLTKSCEIVGLLQGSERPLPETRKKSGKGFRGISALGGQKSSKMSQSQLFQRQVFFRLIFHSFSSSFVPRAGRPRKPLFRLCQSFFEGFLGEAFFDPCERPTSSQTKRSKHLSRAPPKSAPHVAHIPGCYCPHRNDYNLNS